MTEQRTPSGTGTLVEPLVIVGSRLQALILLGVALALVAGAADSLGAARFGLGAALTIGAVAVAIRRVVMEPGTLTIRRLLGTATITPSHAEVEAGHRYLRVRAEQGLPFRIEVPVEIRPQVRDWASAWAGERSRPE